MKKALLIFFAFLFILIAVFPKKNLYYFAENQMSNFKVVLSDELLKEGLFGLDIKNADLFFDGLKIAKIKNIDIFFSIFYNFFTINNFNFDKQIANFPKNIQNLKAYHSIFIPHIVFLNADEKDITASGKINLYKKNIKIQIKINQNKISKYQSLLQGLKKQGDEYIYETNF